MKREIIDSHSHIGFDYTWSIEGKIEEYVNKARQLGIKESLLMPAPMPIIIVGRNKIIPIMLGTYEGENYIIKGIEDSKSARGIIPNENPYKYVNELLYRKISTYESGIKLNFVPLTHPLFDTIEYLEEIINKYKPVALKLHGYSCIISPQEIDKTFWKLIEKEKIPLIIHTDCDTSDEISIDTFYRNENSPLNWLKILEKYDIKAYLTHGVRLCEKSIKIVNESPNFVVGLGPDKILSKCHTRMYSKDEYLKSLFSKTNIDKICFDLNYPWNASSYDDKELDWDSIERIKKLKLKDTELDKVLSKNSKNFFKLN